MRSRQLSLENLLLYRRSFGWLNLAKFLSSEFRDCQDIVVRLPGGRRFVSNRDAFAFMHLARSWWKIHRLASMVPPDADCVVLDVGAHIGMFAVAVERTRDKAEVHAFEPSPRAVEYLRRNVGPWTVVNQTCVGDRDGEVGFYEVESSWQASTVLASAAETWEQVSRIVVPCTTLEAYLDRLDLGSRSLVVKVDVQGLEEQVIRGLGKYSSRVAAFLLESTWLDPGSIRIALEIINQGRSYKVLNAVHGGADLYIKGEALAAGDCIRGGAETFRQGTLS